MEIVFLNIDLAPYHNETYNELIELGHKVKVFYFKKNYPEPYSANSNLEFIFGHPKIRMFSKKTILITAGYSEPAYFISALIHKTIKSGRTKFTCDTIIKQTNTHKFYRSFGRFIFPTAYDQCLVAGIKQAEFATILGFNQRRIKLGCYSTRPHHTLTSLINQPRNHSKILFVGRLEHVKGIIDLIEWFISSKEYKYFTLEIIGYGSLEKEVVTYSKRYSKVLFSGKLSNREVINRMKSAGVFILPSIFEPWGVVVQEACISGCFVITSNKVGSSSFFISEKNGFIFKDFNEIDSALKRYRKQTNKTDIIEFSYSSGIKLHPKKIAENVLK